MPLLRRHIVPDVALAGGNGSLCRRGMALSMRAGPFEFDLDLAWDPDLCHDTVWRDEFDALYGAENFGRWASPAPTASQLATLLNTDPDSILGGPPRFSYGSPVSQSGTSLTYARIGGTWQSTEEVTGYGCAIRIVGFISLLWDPDLTYWQWRVTTTNVVNPCYRDAYLADGTVGRVSLFAVALRLYSAQLDDNLRPGTRRSLGGGIPLAQPGSGGIPWNVTSATLYSS